MTTRTASPAAVAWRLPRWAQRRSGTLLLLVIGLAGKVTEQSIAAYGRAHHLTLPNIEYVLWAIVFGLIISNTVGVPEIFRRGVDTYEFWLKAGIVLLGVRFLLGDIAKLGGVSLVCVAFELAGAIVFMTALGRAFGLRPKLDQPALDRLVDLRRLGHHRRQGRDRRRRRGCVVRDRGDSRARRGEPVRVSAHRPVARDERSRLRPLGRPGGRQHRRSHRRRRALFGRRRQVRGARQDRAQRHDRIRGAGLRLYWLRQQQGRAVGNKAAFLWQKFPKFVLGFLVVSALATAGAFSQGQVTDLANLSRWAFLLTFAGVGLRTNIRDLMKQGWRPLAVGVVGECGIAAVTLLIGRVRGHHERSLSDSENCGDCRIAGTETAQGKKDLQFFASLAILAILKICQGSSPAPRAHLYLAPSTSTGISVE